MSKMATPHTLAGSATPEARRSSQLILCVAYGIGGGCALVYQIVWYHAFIDQFGAAGTTFLVVLCTFISGLGAGAFASQRFYRCLDSKIRGNGLGNYGSTELAVTL